jgi:Fuc2NAc and GlcNAc transferase
LRNAVIDQPNERSSHHVPTPRGGGLAILTGIAVSLLLLGWRAPHDWRLILTLLGGMSALGAIGWKDDHGGVAPRARLALHVAVAVASTILLGGLPEIRIGDSTLHLGGVGAILAVVAIVWSINLFNFMDGIDGIAGAEAMLVATGAAIIAWRSDPTIAGAALAVAAASAGFLAWNWPPAKIFMGDVGSGALGFLLATLALAAERRGSVPVIAFAILASVFIADASVTLIRRVLRGESVSQAHRDHAYQRLSRVWKGHRRVTLAVSALTAMFVAVAWLASVRPVLLLPALGAAAVLLAVALRAVERIAPFGRS